MKLAIPLDNAMIRNILLVCVADLIVGVSYGALAHANGFPLWVPLTLSLVVLAGASEFLFIGVVAAGGSPVSAALAGLLVNARHVPFSLAVHDLAGKGPKKLLGFHILNDESVVFGLAEKQKAAFWLCGLGIFLCWPLGTIIGEFLGTFIVDTKALGLDAMFPAIILALCLPALREAKTRRAALLGAVIALAATPFLPPGIPVLLSLLGLVVSLRRA
ncbi:AzlC family ABC transporter permease [Morganella morganii]|uniref:AzlC family ABC transporter permease n=1 Tax=Morganella morganii TaxID=582 RepID=UPI00053791D7|nr:AzlC family ABC transporter permease [Morganella morganii]AUU01098.1 branched-chain amino acid ABC transporter permease [Morganella morganii]AVD60332.1 branched-chain amino acid ABC transporter permease [Morganella morganii]EHZ6678151.1 AzlC family ABC transporter permease [Morganella morganii]EKU8061163.1 AzlC family ABC transporter permease [Morganella morganii]EKW8498934.1 AzlC family ABC transporter permease [Morganella morganii]